VPYGVDLDRFYPCAERSESEFRLLFVGNISVRKGVRYLLEAFQQLDCKRKHLTLVGSLSPELESTVQHIRHSDQISVMGHVPQQDLKKIMSRSHVMVLPSVEEGMACVQAQVMACGCPVIASQNTGAQDLFTDGREAFIVPICDSQAIADRLQMLADDPDLVTRMGDAALARVKSIGGWQEYGDRMYQIFLEAIAS